MFCLFRERYRVILTEHKSHWSKLRRMGRLQKRRRSICESDITSWSDQKIIESLKREKSRGKKITETVQSTRCTGKRVHSAISSGEANQKMVTSYLALASMRWNYDHYLRLSSGVEKENFASSKSSWKRDALQFVPLSGWNADCWLWNSPRFRERTWTLDHRCHQGSLPHLHTCRRVGWLEWTQPMQYYSSTMQECLNE